MHVSDLKKYNKCKRLYQLSKLDSSAYFSFFNINCDIDATIAKKLAIKEYNTGSVGQTNEDTFNYLNEKKCLFKARLQYRDLRIRIPLLVRDGDNYDLYFYQLSTNCNKDDLINYCCCKYVFDNLNLNINNIYLLYLNEEYVRTKELDCDKLWILVDRFANSEETIFQQVNNSDIDVEKIIEDFDDNSELFQPIRNANCSGHRRCDYYDICFKDELKLPNNSILHLVSSQYKHQMLAEGITELKDAKIEMLEGNRVQYSQILADKNGGLYVDKLSLRNWLNYNIKFPISFIDFEWDLFPIPPYHHMKPMQVLPFQYSLHIYDGKQLEHFEYIGSADSREEMIKSLLASMPQTGSIVAYNAVGAEMMRISELAFAYPKYRKQLESLNARIVDLAYPFVYGLVYNTAMAGSFTLKTIESIIDCKHSYKELDCNNGIKAIQVYRSYVDSTDQKQKDLYYKQLYEYCGLDTYSLYEVYKYLLKITE